LQPGRVSRHAHGGVRLLRFSQRLLLTGRITAVLRQLGARLDDGGNMYLAAGITASEMCLAVLR